MVHIVLILVVTDMNLIMPMPQKNDSMERHLPDKIAFSMVNSFERLMMEVLHAIDETVSLQPSAIDALASPIANFIPLGKGLPTLQL